MPIYEYRCGACGFQKEFLQKMSDPQLKDCPECGKATLSKMVTAAGFQLKGSGWYATDFKHGATPKAKPDDKSTETSADKSTDKSTATVAEKPAAGADAKPAAEAPVKKPEAPAASSKPAATPVGT